MYKAHGLSRAEIRKFVRTLRAKCGYEFIEEFPILIFLENILPQLIPGFTLEILPREDMGNKHGETNPDQLLICIREDVYIGAANRDGRDRFTIAHEIGHLFLHRNSRISLCQLFNKANVPTYENPEWQADAFGGELLAPSYLIKDIEAERISKRFFVSISAANTQLRHLPIRNDFSSPC